MGFGGGGLVAVKKVNDSQFRTYSEEICDVGYAEGGL